MSQEEDRKTISITKWQALSNHEGSVWETDYASVKTTHIDGVPCDDITIKRKVASYVSEIKRQDLEYLKKKAQKGRSRRLNSKRISTITSDNYDDFFSTIGIEDLSFEMEENDSDEPVETDLISPQDIDLIEITDRSRIHADIYPLTFRCRRCGHFQIVSENETNLVCPDCKSKSLESNNYTQRMVQESIIFVCPHCSTIEELTPSNTTTNNVRKGVFDCPKGCGGHLHFYRWEKLGRAYWQCSKCNYREQPVRRNCACSIYSNDQSEEKKDESQVWAMRLNPTSASNTYSLQKTFVEVQKNEISLAILTEKRYKDLSEGGRAWRLNDLLQSLNGFTRGMFQQTYDLSDAFIVNDIESSTVVYGYTTHVEGNRPIRENERLKKCFPRRGGHYRAYLIRSLGRGLVLVFDKTKIAEIVQSEVSPKQRRSYDDLIEEELSVIENGIFQDNLDNPGKFPIISAMHAIEHALFKKASDEAGLEVFGSKILLKDGAILLYERQDVGEGGIIQLTTGQQFLRLANGIYSELSTCGQDCETGCLSCTFINDFNCSPFIESECSRWYPGNSFLNRKLASKIIGTTKV